MRWKIKNRCGQSKIVKRFLFFPFELDNEYRWLELAYITKLYYLTSHGSYWYGWATKEEIDEYNEK